MSDRSWLAVLAAACLALAFLWPGQAPGGGSEWARPVAFALTAAVIVYGATVAVIAWQVGEWSPTFMALGCVSMTESIAGRLLLAPEGFGLAGGWQPGMLPFLGMVIGAGWFAIAARPHKPTDEQGARRARALLLGGTAFGGAVCAALFVLPQAPPEALLRGAGGLAAAGYVVSGLGFLAAYRLLRMPSQMAMAAGSFGFTLASVAMAGGGVPGVAGWQFEGVMIAVASLPATGFILEQRARPGLRSMVLALFFRGALADVRRGYPQRLHDLLAAVSDYDRALHGHLDRVAALSLRLGRKLGASPGELRTMVIAAQCHDVGKITLPKALLNKPGRLSPREWQLMQEHPIAGAEIVRRIPALASAAEAVAEHHERWGGNGYPSGRSGETLSLAGRVVAVADVYDALVSRRAYKEGWSQGEALAEIERGAGSRFDPRVVEALCAVVRTHEDGDEREFAAVA